jgi:phosphonate transport system permease protein
MNTIDMELVAARHPGLLTVPLSRKLRLPIILLCAVAYFAFCFWFFAFGRVFSSADWNLAGAYLADWATFEERPDIRIGADGTMRIAFPKNSSLGDNPNPDWLIKDETKVTRVIDVPPAAEAAAPTQKSTAFNFMATGQDNQAQNAFSEKKTETVTDRVIMHAHIIYSSSKSVDVTTARAEIRNGDEVLTIPLGGKEINLGKTLPSWARQPYAGGKVIISLGFPGWLEVEPDRVKIRKRFFGWANFIFDTNSQFFGKSTSEVYTLITSGPRLNPKESNASLALNDFLYNPSWQHLDVWVKLLQTIVMAFVGTLFASIVSFPLAFVAARNITRNKIANQVTKRFFDFQRSVDMLIWACSSPAPSAPDRSPASRRSFSPIPARWARSMPRPWKTSTTSRAKASSPSGRRPPLSSALASYRRCCRYSSARRSISGNPTPAPPPSSAPSAPAASA